LMFDSITQHRVFCYRQKRNNLTCRAAAYLCRTMPKQHPKEIAIADYSYDLPEDRIAQHPLVERDASKVLILRDGEISETIFRRLPEVLPEGSLLVFNDTRVVQARLEFKRSTGGRVEVFCIDGAGMELVQLMTATGTVVIRALVGNAKK